MWYHPGDVVSVTVNGVIRHEGIMMPGGRIISNSRRMGGVVEESAQGFSGGRKITNMGKLSGLSPDVVVARAQARVGRRYDAVNYNCQHFVRDCWGLSPRSPQKRLALGAGALAALAALL